MTRNTQYPEEKWEEMRPYITQRYLDEKATSRAIVPELLQRYGWYITERQLKNRINTKWHMRKKVGSDTYFAMRCVLDYKGSHVVFHVPLAHTTTMHNNGSIRKECTRKEGNQKKRQNTNSLSNRVTMAPEWQDYVKAMSSLKYSGVRITGLGSDPYSGIPDFNEDEDAENSADGEDIESLTQSPRPEQLTMAMSPRENIDSDEQRPRANAFSRYIAGIVGLTHSQQSNPFSCNPTKDKPFGRPQNDGIDAVSEAFAKAHLNFPPQDPSRLRFEKLLDCDLSSASKHLEWDLADRLAVEFASYYFQQCLSTDYEDLDPFDHPERVACRARLSELFHARTGELIQVLWWLMTVISTHYKMKQLGGLLDDIISCIGDSNDQYTKALRPIFEVARRANSQFIETIYAELEYQRSPPDANLELEFRQNIEYLRHNGMSETGDFVIMQMFLVWHLCGTGRPQETIHVLLDPSCLPLGERVLGSHHLAIVNCKAIAATCYRQLGNPLANTYMNEAMFCLRDCTKPLQPFRNVLRRQQAAMEIAQGRRSNGIEALKGVVNFRVSTFGFTSPAVWSVIKEMHSIVCNEEEQRYVNEIEREIRAREKARTHRRSRPN